MEVDPASLRAAAVELTKQSNQVDEWTKLGGANVATQLTGLSAAALFTEADTASRQAKTVLQSRIKQLGNLLNISAAAYTDTDTDTAERLAKFADMNAADAPARSY
ncbi:hypothetical protein FEK33_29360 [Nocardia asteroides NBRC 15531]|uniref:type VII secretion target n=1 Tax=Nocardia asteroides TaxID=1824 RepID=UPI000F825BD2|nr:type VII secretion target [Nocardia asteroides]TLF62555.1 hypothetical protein FEK33_29360 [Nocardia asteroides NBRC 15531]UGT46773.1 hypothetical protein LT345_19770 [Nocardia asteroides]